jgi:molybdopterin converting factor small subunit
MKVRVSFYSYFRDLAGCAETTADLTAGQTVRELFDHLAGRFPKLAPARDRALVAVGVEYAARDQQLVEGDEVSFFPPVQGG